MACLLLKQKEIRRISSKLYKRAKVQDIFGILNRFYFGKHPLSILRQLSIKIHSRIQGGELKGRPGEANIFPSPALSSKVMTPSQPSTSQVHMLTSRRQLGLLHLRSCGDLSTFSLAGRPRAERRPQRAEAERPHSLIGVIRETVL